MQNALTAAIQSMHNDQTRLDSIARNLANVSTPGYKREVVASKPFGDVLRAAGTAGPTPISMPEVSTSIDTRPGSIKLTSEALDLAIEGEGFFEVAMPDGPAYTRHGRFHLDARGRLVTEAGAAVMGRSGELQLTGTQPSIDRQGVVTDAGKTVGQLKAVTFPAGTSLVRLGDGLYRPSSAGVVPQESKDPVRQGYVENSNVASMTEMVRLVETMRHFESAQKVIQGYDEMLEKSLRKLGEF